MAGCPKVGGAWGCATAGPAGSTSIIVAVAPFVGADAAAAAKVSCSCSAFILLQSTHANTFPDSANWRMSPRLVRGSQAMCCHLWQCPQATQSVPLCTSAQACHAQHSICDQKHGAWQSSLPNNMEQIESNLSLTIHLWATKSLCFSTSETCGTSRQHLKASRPHVAHFDGCLLMHRAPSCSQCWLFAPVNGSMHTKETWRIRS
jgi:hypothetical protein